MTFFTNKSPPTILQEFRAFWASLARLNAFLSHRCWAIHL